MSAWDVQIEAELNWREAELASLKRVAVSSPRNSVQESALLRALCALLYAHYEGFCKFAWNLYLDVLSNSGVARSDCKGALILLSVEEDLSKIRQKSLDEMWQFCSADFQSLLTQQLVFDEKTKMDTSNLHPETLRKHCKKVLFPHSVLDENDVTLVTLIRRRNEIAHGQKNMIASLADYQKYEKAAQLVMHEMAVSVVEALDTKSYLK